MNGKKNALPRRRFLKAGIGAIGGIFGISYMGLIGRYLSPPAIGAEPLVEVGKVADFPSGAAPKLVAYKHGGVEEGVYVENLEDEGWVALDFHCTHLQCAVNWFDATKSFICPCHGGMYDIKGNVKGGPPPRALYRRVIQIQGDSVMLGGRLV
ncbi:MAG: QcrA and Rieske domain-containing protein [Desulfitobacteriaceae bacterium]